MTYAYYQCKCTIGLFLGNDLFAYQFNKCLTLSSNDVKMNILITRSTQQRQTYKYHNQIKIQTAHQYQISSNLQLKMINLASRLIYRFSLQYPEKPDLSCADNHTFYYRDLIKNLIPDRPNPTFNAEALTFGTQPADHMVTIRWSNSKWQAPQIKPFETLQLHPFNSTFHYGVQCYEGLKAYKNTNGQVRIFRPECNMARFKKSSKRVSLPDFDGQQLLKVLEEYVRVCSAYIPPKSGYSLYLRPFHISMQDSLGVKSPSQSQILIVSSPVGPYYPTGFNPISLYCDTQNIRSAPGGTGGFKLGGNYGPTIALGDYAAQRGHQQVLWLYDGKVGQVGSSNIFFVEKCPKTGKKSVITPELQDLVLPGVTRDSIMKLLKHKGIEVQQRSIMIDEVLKKIESGQIIECFGAGTAVIVSPIKNIEYKGKQYAIKINQEFKSGDLTYEIFNTMLAIQEGRGQDYYGWSRHINKEE